MRRRISRIKAIQPAAAVRRKKIKRKKKKKRALNFIRNPKA